MNFATLPLNSLKQTVSIIHGYHFIHWLESYLFVY